MAQSDLVLTARGFTYRSLLLQRQVADSWLAELWIKSWGSLWVELSAEKRVDEFWKVREERKTLLERERKCVKIKRIRNRGYAVVCYMRSERRKRNFFQRRTMITRAYGTIFAYTEAWLRSFGGTSWSELFALTRSMDNLIAQEETFS